MTDEKQTAAERYCDEVNQYDYSGFDGGKKVYSEPVRDAWLAGFEAGQAELLKDAPVVVGDPRACFAMGVSIAWVSEAEAKNIYSDPLYNAKLVKIERMKDA
jgi:hypothetical protein